MTQQRDLFGLEAKAPRRGMWLYRKNTTSDARVRRALAAVPLSYGPDCMVYTDDPASLGAWNRLKAVTDQYDGGLVIISSIGDIARTPGGVADEVAWITERNLETVVMDCPSSFVFDDPRTNGMIFRLLAEVWDNLVRTFPRQKKRTGVGRMKFDYPEGWDRLYSDWKTGRIRTKDIIEATGFSSATVFSRIREFAPIADGTVEIFPTRTNPRGNFEYVRGKSRTNDPERQKNSP